MGKRTKQREAQLARAANDIAAVLSAHSKRRAGPALVTSHRDFKPHYQARIEPYQALAVRSPDKWCCRLRSRCENERFKDFVAHTFARYPLPAHLGSVWVEDIHDDFVDRVERVVHCHAIGQRPDLREWYLIAAQGGSLYKRAAHPHLSSLETHYFLTAPSAVNSTRQAFWYAIARTEAPDPQTAFDIARSRLTDFSVASTFWREVARFFARHPTTISEMNDLIEFIFEEKSENDSFSVKGRTLASLRRRLQEWQQELLLLDSSPWTGAALPDFDYRIGAGATAATWRFRQIKTPLGLAREGKQMRHCVGGYEFACRDGLSSIWSLTVERAPEGRSRSLTIELRDKEIHQCRGFANRLASPEEIAVLQRWAKDFALK